MDIFAHGLWTAAAAKGINLELEKRKPGRKITKLNVWLSAFWGVLPDLFAFAPIFVWAAFHLLHGDLNFAVFRTPEFAEPPQFNSLWITHLTSALYNLSHSAIVFALAFLAVWLIKKKPVLEMGGWLLHVLIDIPTHTYRFYPTPALWPISGWKFSGISWANPWFMAANYSAIAIAYLLLRRVKTKSEKTDG